MIYRLLLGVLFLLGPATLQARDLSLEQALRMAEEHSFNLKKAQANSAGAKSDYAAATADRLPTLNLAGTSSYISKTAEMNLTIPGLGSLHRDIGSHDRYQADLRLNLPLFTGGRISGTIDAASATSAYYNALALAGQDQIDYVARLEYLNLFRAERLVQAALSTQKRTQVILDNINSLYSAGAADSVDLLEAQLAANKADLGVRQAQTARRSSEIRLLTLLGLDLSGALAPTDSFPVPVLDPATDTLWDSKPELQAAQANVQLLTSRLRVAKADYWPNLSAYGGYSYGKPNLDQFGNTWNDYWTIGANLNWSFNIGGKTARKTRAAKYYLQAASNDRDQVRENLQRDVSLSYEQMALAYASYQNAREQFRITSDDYRLAQQQHANGDLATNRLLEIQADLSTAEASLAASQVDFYLAQTAHLYALGSDKLRKGL